jgi:hypothetical protein
MQALRRCLTTLALVYTLLPPAPASALLDPLTVSPTAPRHQKPADPRNLIVDVPPAERAAMLASIRVEDTTESLTVKSRNDFSHEIPDTGFEEIRVPVGTIAHGPNGSTLELKAIGVYYPHNLREAKEPRGSLSYFTPQGEPISTSQLEALGVVGWQSEFPQPKSGGLYQLRCSFYFAQRLNEGVRTVGFSLKDARTSYVHGGGFYSGSSRDGQILMFQPVPSIRHPSPIEVRVDCAFPPFEERAMDATPDTTVSFPSFDMRFLGAYRTGAQGWRSSPNSIGFMKSTINPDLGPSISYLFAAVPQLPAANLSFDVMASDGSLLGVAHSNAMSLGVLSCSFTGADAPPARFVIKRPTKLLRFAFELPELPGLPPENRGVADLLDVVVPYARFQFDAQFCEFLRGATQMNIKVTNPPPNRPNPAAAPMEYENVTVRTMLHEFAKQQGPYRIYSDIGEETIIIETPEDPSPARQELERKLKAVF